MRSGPGGRGPTFARTALVAGRGDVGTRRGMTDRPDDAHDDEPIDEVVRDTVDDHEDPTTRREAVEQELAEQGRSDEGADLDVSRIIDAPAAGVLDEDLEDPPEPIEPG